MSTVYIVNKGGHDYSDAKRFGSLEFLSEGAVSPFSVNKIYRDFAMRLRRSSPDDFILLTSLTILNVVATSCFSFLHNGRLNILLFRNGRYIERRLELKELLTSDTKKQMQEAIDG